MTTRETSDAGQDVIIDPDLPELDRYLLRRSPNILIPASHPVPATSPYRRGQRHAERAARAHHGRYLVVSEDFDAESRAFLRRAEKAYISVLCSQTVAQHLIDSAELTPLPHRFYQLSYLLYLQSRMRAQLDAAGLPYDGHHTGALEGIHEELRLSLEQAERGTRELETLAGSIAQMDARLHKANRQQAITGQRESARSAAEEIRLALTRATRYQELVTGDLAPLIQQLDTAADAISDET